MKKIIIMLIIFTFTLSLVFSKGSKEEDIVAEEKTLAEDIEISILLIQHFVPESDEVLDDIIAKWGSLTGVKVSVDHISSDEIANKISSEINIGEGHDIVEIIDLDNYIYKDTLSDVSILMEEIQEQSGKVLQVGESISLIDGVWRSIPFYHQSFPLLFRKDYCEEVGYTLEDMNNLTLASFLELAKKLDASGHQLGIPISTTNDARCILPPILWAFGGALFGKDNAIIVYSSETKAALEYILELSQYMPPDVTGWDSAANNLLILSGEGAVTANPPSIYASAKNDNLEFADQIYHGSFPSGPAGSYRNTFSFSLAIPEYSENKEQAADLIKYILERENFVEHCTASAGYNQPMFEGLQDVPIWSENPNLTGYEPATEDYMFVTGWPGPKAYPTTYTTRADLMGVMGNMFAKVVAGEATPDEAMEWAEGELKRLVEEESQ